MKIATTFAALAIATIATPASADTSANLDNRSGAAAAVAPAPSAEKKYCIQYKQMVGSRLNRQDCKTKQQWAKEGVDVDELLAK